MPSKKTLPISPTSPTTHIKVHRRTPEDIKILNALKGMQNPPITELGPDEKTPVTDMGPALKIFRISLKE